METPRAQAVRSRAGFAGSLDWPCLSSRRSLPSHAVPIAFWSTCMCRPRDTGRRPAAGRGCYARNVRSHARILYRPCQIHCRDDRLELARAVQWATEGPRSSSMILISDQPSHTSRPRSLRVNAIPKVGSHQEKGYLNCDPVAVLWSMRYDPGALAAAPT